MKLRKLLVALLAVVMAVGVATAFAACGDGDKPDDKKPANDKSYQLSGEFRDNLQVLGDGFDFLLDWTVTAARYLRVTIRSATTQATRQPTRTTPRNL